VALSGAKEIVPSSEFRVGFAAIAAIAIAEKFCAQMSQMSSMSYTDFATFCVVVVGMGLSDKKYCGDSGLACRCNTCCLAVSNQLSAVSKYMFIHKHRIAGFEEKRVTKWSLFLDEFTNDFEGTAMLKRSGYGWEWVDRCLGCLHERVIVDTVGAIRYNISIFVVGSKKSPTQEWAAWSIIKNRE